MSLPNISGIGNLVADPELRYAQNGKAILNLRIAFNRRRKTDSGQWEDADSAYVSAALFDQQAERMAQHLTKGDKVAVMGQLKHREYETKEGQKRTSTEVQFPIVEKIEKAPQAGGNGGGWSQNQQPQQQPQQQGFGGFGNDEPPF
ncbi:single-stranded DNA-binding protein [Corynebacterium heidelbergense]|nr:single-stranded DNA-binding protein [Corynebacterium heidelbergense]WCZ36028.1 Single-stranded DNA-binding protein [Corynebacterium heidelbergense]